MGAFAFCSEKTNAKFHSALYREHIVWDLKRACEESCHSRLIQRCFMRALRWNADGEIDESLVPKEIREWYKDSDDEKETSSESESDCED